MQLTQRGRSLPRTCARVCESHGYSTLVRKKQRGDVARWLSVLFWESVCMSMSGKCEQWEEKNVWSSFSCLQHTTQPFWRLTSRRITAPKRWGLIGFNATGSSCHLLYVHSWGRIRHADKAVQDSALKFMSFGTRWTTLAGSDLSLCFS